MLTYEVLKESPKWLRAFTSLDAAEFEALLPAIDQVWQAYQREEERKRGKAYRRKSGGGRKVRLKRSEDKLVFILVYVKVYPLQEVQGQMFDLSQGQANVWIHILMPLLKAALGRKKQLPEREVHHLAETLAGSDGLDFIIDGTERRRQRPKNPLKQKEYYSSKKKAHTVKNNVIANADTQHVAYLSQTVPGKTHDKKLCDQEQYTFPALSLLEKDTGFQGY